MIPFEQRQRTIENQFMHEEELHFKTYARRNKLVGLWAAELMQIHGIQATNYAFEIMEVAFEEPGDEDIIRKLLHDFHTHDIAMGRDTILQQLAEKEAIASAELTKQAQQANGAEKGSRGRT